MGEVEVEEVVELGVQSLLRHVYLLWNQRETMSRDVPQRPLCRAWRPRIR